MQLQTKAFTLIELLVAITIIGIIVLGGSQLNFNRISDKQKLDIFNNKVVSLFENIRNNALLGRGIGVNLDVPEKWKIIFLSGEILPYYSLSNDNWIPYDLGIQPEEYIKISNFNCLQLDTSTGTTDVPGENIIITGNHLSFSGSCINSDKILQFDTSYKDIFQNTFHINTLNGLIEVD